MKRIVALAGILALLCGCSYQTVFERVEDTDALPVSAPAQQLQITFPTDAVMETMGSQNGELYICDGYTLSIQTMDSGDLDRSLRRLTGFSEDKLMVMQTEKDGVRRYDTVWTSAGEGGAQTGRLALLDDGQFHYAAVLMASAELAGDLTAQWNEILDSLELVSTG